ncbi:MAG TPA: PEP/pyruvate-binding domain-containing protein [bacterium]|nr:PEP/pyruvate-binding domain-containing protein [bacterium]
MANIKPSTGIESLDKVLNGIKFGDNIVWQVDTIEDYISMVKPYCSYAKENGKKIIYFRFADHKELVSDDDNAEIYRLNPREGFEQFITEVHRIIEQTGKYGFYLFDSYSELTLDCYSDRMLGNFFILTCPYLYELETIAYFSIYRNHHSYHAVLPIKQTTQLFIDIYKHNGDIYAHPLKADGRFSSTMFMMHKCINGIFTPIKDSPSISEILTSTSWPGLQSASYRMIGPWDKKFMQAEAMAEAEKIQCVCNPENMHNYFYRLMTLLISKEKQILDLAEKYLELKDVIYIWKRMIGTGMIGGKTVGMLLARSILIKTNPRWKKILEPHDSFFIGSDVFYSYLVYNNCWLIRQKQKKEELFLEDIDEAQNRILNGEFPEYIIKRFSDLLDYYGQSPIIVRSSSLLEDNFGNAFAGKYESVFCANQGDLKSRLDEFLKAVKIIYASAMSETALSYRKRRGVLEKDEQMALLVQRVSGTHYHDMFFPHLSGVGFSYNPYVWNENIDPEAGMMRIVFGLGTRAVDRADDDYTRVVALNAPELRPEADFSKVKKYAQRRFDYIDLLENKFNSGYFIDMVKKCPELQVEMFATPDYDNDSYYYGEYDNQIKPWVLTFDSILQDTGLIDDIKEMFKILKETYNQNVDVEFAVNFNSNNEYKINLLQCRPLQITRQNGSFNSDLKDPANKDIILKTSGGIVGHSRIIPINCVIYVVPEIYGLMSENDRYSTARLIGKLTRKINSSNEYNIMIFGPGRWGTSMPSLGVPVSFNEINNVSVLCEIDSMHEGLVPDLSLGTHFFNEMVEMNMLYIAFFKNKSGNIINADFFSNIKNRLADILPEEKKWESAVKITFDSDMDGYQMLLNADSFKQKCSMFLKKIKKK